MKRKSLIQDVKGQGIIEFALVIPILLLLVFGVVDLSRFAFYQSVLNQAARETVRIATVGGSLDEIETTLLGSTKSIVGPATISTSVGNDPEGNAATLFVVSPSSGPVLKAYITPPYTPSIAKGSSIRINLSYSMNYITPLSRLWGNSMNIKVRFIGRMENPPTS